MWSHCRLIFLGETFNGFISVHNGSQEVAKDVAVKVYINTEEETLERETTSTDFLLNYPQRKHLWSYLKCFPLCVGGVTDSVSPSSAPVRAPPAAAGSLRLRGENHLPRGQGTWRTQVSFSLPSSTSSCVCLKCEYVVCKCYFIWTVSLL